MWTAKARIAATCLAALALQVGTASGAEMKGSGTVTYTIRPAARVALPGDRFLTESRLKGVILANDPKTPFHLASQDCGDAAVTDAKGVPMESTGVCVAIDKDGDVWWLWYNNKGDKRSWSVISGTGKYAGMTGGGTTEILTATADGRLAIMWSGTLNTK